ncbi:VOC family protein [Streptomyces fumanus]|uniref:VOC family protein n=1 Tax=Streptomyces fumanus TaxID=67302 RepID=UPI0033F38735
MAENRASADAEGVPCWVDAQLPDVAAGRRFYGGLFGWAFDAPAGPSGAVLARLGGEPVAALVPKTDGRMPTVWTVYFATADAGALAARIEARGGQLVTAPHPAADLGAHPAPDPGADPAAHPGADPAEHPGAHPAAHPTPPPALTALAADPQGAVFGLREPGAAGFGGRRVPGGFAWAELYTRDTEAADAFYGDLFHAALFGPGAAPDFGRAAVTEVFPAEMPPHFLVHFRVADRAAALERVARLGGRVQAPPFEASYGRVAVVTDDQGASFALLER